MFQLITLGVAAAIVVAILLLTDGSAARRMTAIKALALTFCAIGFVRQYLADSIYLVINGGYYEGVFYENTDLFQIIIRWGYSASYSVFLLAAFSRVRVFRNIAGYVTLPFVLLSLADFNGFMEYFTDPRAGGFLWSYGVRAAYFVLELAIAIALPVLIHISERHLFRVKSITEWRNFILCTVGVTVITMPSYVPQSILGYVAKEPDSFSAYHVIWMAVILLTVLTLYYSFRFRAHDERYALCLYLAVVLFFHYNSVFIQGVTLGRLPIQLCNMAAYFILIATVFKLEGFFHFSFIANVVGTVIAIVGPDFGLGQESFFNVHFLYEHLLVLVIPALLAGLRIFRRLEPGSLKPFLIGYTSYFLFCFIVGTILNGYSDITGETVNYFYMFDLGIAFDYFPFLTFTGNYYFTIGRFVVYPMVILCVYVGFLLLCLIFYALVRFFYKLEDDHLALRLSGIELYEKLSGKESKRPKHFID